MAVFILLVSSLFSSISVRIVHSVTTIYINADGSITPFTAPITTVDNITYSCIGDMMDSNIEILRDNIVLKGNNHTLQGSVSMNTRVGVTLEELGVSGSVSANDCMNTTIKGIAIRGSIGAGNGIASAGRGNSIIGNTVDCGKISIENSLQDLVSGNIVYCYDRYMDRDIFGHGIWLSNITDCIIRENVVNGAHDAIRYSGSNCSIYGNNVTDCRHGVVGEGDQTIFDSNNLLRFWTERESSSHQVVDTVALQFSGTNHTISHNLIADSSNTGIILNVFDSTVEGNTVQNCAVGFMLNGRGNTLVGNNIADNTASIARALGDESIAPSGLILGGGNITLRNNTMEKNEGGFSLNTQGDLPDFINDIDVSNKIDGRPIYYWVSEHNRTVPNDAGYVALVNCTDIVVQNLDLGNNGQGLFMAFTTNSTVANNNITDNRQGILLRNCPRNTIRDNYVAGNNPGFNIQLESSPNGTIYRNMIASSTYGAMLIKSNGTRVVANTFMFNYYGANLYIDQSFFCVVYHNNFIQESAYEQNQIFIVSGSNSTFDNGYPSGGNYWSDYSGIDTYSAGIGFPYYTISGEAQDTYPLMGQMHYYDVSVSANATHIELESNSTISDFQYSESAKYIRFNAEGPNGTVGFCRIAVPQFVYENLWHSNVSIFVNGTLTPHTNFTDSQSVYLYFTYTQSAHDIVAVPEYLWLVFIVLTILAIVGVTFGLKWHKNAKRTRTHENRKTTLTKVLARAQKQLN